MAALAISLLAPLGMSIATAAPASADSEVPAYMTAPGGAGNEWYEKKWPSRSTAPGGGGLLLNSTDEWLYPDFPIACNPNPGDTNHYKVFYVHGASQPSTYDQSYVRKALRAASSVFAASALERISNDGHGTPLNRLHAPRWETTAPGGAGNCYPKVTVLSVPDEVLTVGTGNGFWSPFRSTELNDHLASQGLIGDVDQKTVVLLQKWGTPKDAVGVTTNVVSSTQPDKSNSNNRGGRLHSIYAEVEGSPTGSRENEWTATAHTIAHEITHNLGGLNTLSPNRTSDGHAKDCYDVLCERAGNADYFPVAECGATANYGLTEMRGSKFYNRLDCREDDYWTVYNRASWAQTRWNAYNNSFLWANAGNEQ